MKINGQPQSEKYLTPVALPRPDGSHLPLTLKPLPLGFHRQLKSRGLVPPKPPTRVARESDGRAVRDPQGLAVLVRDEHDVQYLAELELYHQRVAILVAAESLSGDRNVELESEPPNRSADWTGYADTLHREFEQAGWSDGDLIWLCDQVCRLSNLVDEHLKETHGNFSQPPPGETTSTT